MFRESCATIWRYFCENIDAAKGKGTKPVCKDQHPATHHNRYRLMFEDRDIRVLAYNLETVLAEKFTTVLSLDIANSRMKDFYDIHILVTGQRDSINAAVFAEAVNNTATQRSMASLIPQAAHIVETIAKNPTMGELWKRYRTAYKYATGIEYAEVMNSLLMLSEWCIRQT